MTDAAWLDHDFPHEHVPAPAGLMFVGQVLDVDVFCLDGLDAGGPLPASDAATGDPNPSTVSPLSGSGSPARAIDHTKSQLIAQLLDLIVPKPGQWHSFILGYVRRAHVDRLEELPVEVLHTVVEQAHALAAARGQRPAGASK